MAGMMLFSGSVAYADETGDTPAETHSFQEGTDSVPDAGTESGHGSEEAAASEKEAGSEPETEDGTAAEAPRTMSMVLQEGDGLVAFDRFTIYKDGMEGGQPAADVLSGSLSDNAPDLTGEYLYFDHAEVEGKRVYEVGALQGITYYSSITGTLSILGEDETVELYYISRYPVSYTVTGAEKTSGDGLVRKGDSLTFRAKPSGKGKRLKVSVNGSDISDTGVAYDDTTGERLFTIENAQGALSIDISETDVDSYTLTYSQEEDSFRNGSITSPESGQTITPDGTVTIQMESSWKGINRYVLNMLVINGHEVATPPSDAREGAFVDSTLPGGETVRVTLTQEDTILPAHYTNDYTVTISNIYTDLHISEANFKLDDRKEIILKELSGIKDIVGWDFAEEKFVEGSVNHVYEQTGKWGNEFYFNLLPGYENPQLTVKVNGREINDADVHFGENTGKLDDGGNPSYTYEQYQYRFNIPDDLGDNVELFLAADPVSYSVEYRNDKNKNDLIAGPETGFTVEAGHQDTITITSRIPYETEPGFTPDGYIVKGDPEQKVYHSGDTVPVKDVAAYAEGNTILFVPNWVDVKEMGERQITVNLYIENPISGDEILADTYLVSVGEGKALLRPDDKRGREHIREFLEESEKPWASTYDTDDFVLRAGEEAVRVVEADEDSVNFHYDVKKGLLTVKFAWGTGEEDTGVLPGTVTKSVAILQEYEEDISDWVPKGYMASSTKVTGIMTEGGVEKTIYLYKDSDDDGRPDAYTVTLTFDAKADGIINTDDAGLAQGGIPSQDKKTLTYRLVKAGAAGIQADIYPGYIPRITVMTEGKGWMGWREAGGTDAYALYAGEKVGEDAENITFEAGYDVAEGYETVTVSYHWEQEDGTFVLNNTIERLGKADETVEYTRNHMDGYITPNEGINGSITVTKDGVNKADVYYYRDADKNGKSDTYTLTLCFQGSGKGSWDIEDSMWEQMTEGKDYVYDRDTATLTVFLVKENPAGFQEDAYPDAPKVKAEATWLFDSWQDQNGNAYGSDGVIVGSPVGGNDVGRQYTAVYDRDLNQDGTPDDEQSVTVVFKEGEHGTTTGKREFTDLVPGFHSYPSAPAVEAAAGYVFAGWEPAYTKGGTIEKDADRNQEYTAVYKEDKNNDGIADDGQSVTVTFRAEENGTVTGESRYTDLLPGIDCYPAAPDIKAAAGYVFTGWEPAYTKEALRIEANAPRNQIYTAVIEEDKNANGRPDDEEKRYTLTYDGNAQSGGTAENLPGENTAYLSGEKALLNSITIPVHTEVSGMTVVFLGWASERTTRIYGKGDAEEFEKVPLLTEVVFSGSDETVYAVWGYDSEGDGSPDVRDTYYAVSTILNGEGTGHRITPENPFVKEGADQEFAIAAESGYAVRTIAVNGETRYINNNAAQSFNGAWTLEGVTENSAVIVTFGTDADGNGIPDEYENPNLTGIVAPAAITGVPNGTALDEISLPEKVVIRTTDSEKQADVSWNTGEADYDPAEKEAQTFTVEGTVTLPEGVDNRNGLSLTTSVCITVEGWKEPEVPVLTGLIVKKQPEKTVYTEGEALDLAGLVVTLCYSDGSAADVIPEKFAVNEIVVSPEPGMALSTAYNQVTVSKGGFSGTIPIVVNAMEQAAAPVFSVAGGVYDEAQTIELSTETEGASIYYTTDGSIPTTDSTRYEEAVRADSTMTIRAVAVKAGMRDSEISSASYIIRVEPEVPEYTLTVENGTGDGRYAEKAEATIKADAAPDGKIFDRWISPDGGIFADAESPETVFIMPGKDVTITAVYRDKDSEGTGEESGGGDGGGVMPPDDNGLVLPDDGETPVSPDEDGDPELPEDDSSPLSPDNGGSGEAGGSAGHAGAGQADKNLSAGDAPETRDNTSPMLWTAALAVSCVCLMAVSVFRRKSKRRGQ